MTVRTFWLQISVLTIGTIALLFGLSLTEPLQPYRNFSWISLFFFVILSISMYLIGKKAALSPQKNLFTQLILVFTLIKMLLSVLIVLLYHRAVLPESNWFLLPFFLVYLIYTIFETYFMIRIGKMKKPAQHE